MRRFALGLTSLALSLLPASCQSTEAEEHDGAEVKVALGAVPAAVKAAIEKEVGEGRLVDVSEITKTDGTKVYEIEMRQGEAEFDVLFDAAGKVLAKEKQEAEEDDDDDK